MKKYFLPVFLFLLCGPANAQSIQNLTEAELRDFRDQAIQKLNSLTFYFTKISNRETSPRIRERYIKHAENLFKEKAIIQVSSKSGGITNYSVPGYLNHINTYSYEVVIMGYDAERFKLTEFRKVTQPDGRAVYQGIATVVQEFCGIRNQNPEFSGSHSAQNCDYSDRTYKTIEVVIESKRCLDSESGYCLLVLLGDIKVLKTE